MHLLLILVMSFLHSIIPRILGNRLSTRQPPDTQPSDTDSKPCTNVTQFFNWTIGPGPLHGGVVPITQSILNNSPLKPYEISDFMEMHISFNPGNLTNGEIYESMCDFRDTFDVLLDAYRNWIKAPEIYQSLPLDTTSFEDCEPLYSSLSGAINESIPDDPKPRWDGGDISLSFLEALLGDPDSHFDPAGIILHCPFELTNISNAFRETLDTGPCPRLNRDEWIHRPVTGPSTENVPVNGLSIEDNLMQFVHGGIDIDGIGYKALGNASLSSRLREVFLGAYPSNCTLESPCEPLQDCKQVGTRFTASPNKPIRRSTWAYFVLTSIANINQQLFNQFEALQSAAIEGSLAGFNIDDYFPKPGKHLALKNLITGLSTVLAAVSGFIPFIGPELEVAGAAAGTLGAIASGAGTYFDRSLQKNIDRSDPNVAQKRFAPTIRQVFRVFSESPDNITAELLRGEQIGINNTFHIFDMLRGGTWVDRDALSKIAHLQEQVFNEITSRAIDGLWKTPTSNKMWVLYVDLGDDHNQTKCKNDPSGPPTLKYCGDGGVYYAYNFVEKGDLIGHRDYPWGADKMKLNLGIDPAWITEASANTYRLAKDSTTGYGLDPFNFDPAIGANNTLFYIANGSDILGADGKGLGGRYPGSWTLPVCNASTWGHAWNYDYTQGARDKRDNREHPPCFCGEGGLETAHWATAAGLNHFDTFYQRCQKALQGTGDDPADFLTWPDGVTSVDLGFGEPIYRIH